jgi:AraC-like DNA-binding protein
MNRSHRICRRELSKQYDIPATSMKKCFREIYGDSIYSYQKRYRMNIAANLLMEDFKIEIQEIALRMGYENPGKFSSAFKSVMGVSPAKYRMRKEGIL